MVVFEAQHDPSPLNIYQLSHLVHVLRASIIHKTTIYHHHIKGFLASRGGQSIMVSYTRLPSGSCMTLLNPAPVRLPHVLHFGHGSTDVFLIVLHHTVPRSRYKNSNLM